ncbi:MAG: DMT family transporter [Clostridia bacterium]
MNNKFKGIAFMCLSAMSFSMMQIFIALTAERVPLFEQLIFRNLLASLIAYSSVRKNNLQPFGLKENRKLLFWRSFTGFLGMITLFYASANANQGDVAILNKMSPFIVTLMSYFFLKEKITKYQKAGLVIAFSGAFFVANPEFNSNIFPLFIAVLSAIFAGLAYTFLGMLRGKEHPSVIIFCFSLFSTIVCIPALLFDFVLVSFTDLLYLILIGVMAALGQITLTHAFIHSKPVDVSIYNYSGIIFSMLFGYIFLNQQVKSTSAIGAILVIISATIVYFGTRKEETL